MRHTKQLNLFTVTDGMRWVQREDGKMRGGVLRVDDEGRCWFEYCGRSGGVSGTHRVPLKTGRGKHEMDMFTLRGAQ